MNTPDTPYPTLPTEAVDTLARLLGRLDAQDYVKKPWKQIDDHQVKEKSC